jgi:hypothetical protein
MNSPLETTVRQWLELGLLRNRRLGEGDTGDTGSTTENITTTTTKKKRRKKTDKDWEYSSNTSFQQTTLSGGNQTKADVEVYGNILQTKEDNTFRVISQNVQTIPVDARSESSRRAVNTMISTESDVFLVSEVKVYWPRVEQPDKWFEQVIGRFRAH